MPPKKSSVRRAEAARAGKDADTVADTHQQTLEETNNPPEDPKTGEKRSAPIDLTETSEEKKEKVKKSKNETDNVTQQDVQAAGRRDGAQASKRQKQEAADKAGLEGGADEIDEKSEQAKAAGREILESDEVETRKPSRGTLESGHIYYFYKPKVETEDPENIDDVAKFHILLLPNPSSNEDIEDLAEKPKYRFLTCGRKHLPASRDDGNHEVEWGMVTSVGQELSDLKDALGPSTYETKTRGTRHQPASRCAGQGYYILHSPTSGEGVKPLEKVTDTDHPRDFPVHLAYSIAVPPLEEFGDVQTELCIKPTGSFVVQVKNPDTASNNPRAASSSKRNKTDYPPELRGLFTTRFIPANPVELLDYPGQELLFISGRDHLPDDSEKEVQEPAEKESKEFKEQEKKSKDEDEAVFKEVFEELHIFKNKKDVPGIKALEGEWA